MKKLTISGDRQVGKTSFLVNSIAMHLTDISLQSDLSLIVSAPGNARIKLVHDRLVKQLASMNEDFSYTQDVITVGDRKCKFVKADPKYFIGLNIDYIFLDDADFLPKPFLDFIDMIMRPHIVVIQTQTVTSSYLDEVTAI